MKKKKWFLFSGISGVLAALCFIVGLVASTNLPSGVSYDVAKSYDDSKFIRLRPYQLYGTGKGIYGTDGTALGAIRNFHAIIKDD